MSTKRQKVLFLYSSHSDFTSAIVAWSLYDGVTGKPTEAFGADIAPPYKTVLEAMHDGWRVMQVSPLQDKPVEDPHQVSYLKYETILEKLEDIDA